MDIMTLLLGGCVFGALLLLGFALQPSSETTSISQRLEGLKAGQQSRGTGTLRDQDEMSKSAFTRVVLPMVDKLSKVFSQLTPVTSLNRAKVTIARAGLQGKVTPTQITTLSYILMVVVPVMSRQLSTYGTYSEFCPGWYASGQ